MARDYYVVLGIPRDAGTAAIRSAFRRLALRYHPDKSGEADSRIFREVADAYRVLSDPERRARYDRDINRSRSPVSVTVVPAPVRDPEPLIPPVSIYAGRPEPLRPNVFAVIELFKETHGLANAWSIRVVGAMRSGSGQPRSMSVGAYSGLFCLCAMK